MPAAIAWRVPPSSWTNRAGVALAEIVSKPDLRTGREAAEYAQIRRIMRYLGVSDGNMQEGSPRCDVNISVRRGRMRPSERRRSRTANSFSAIQKACEYEIKRQIKAYETGEPIVRRPASGTRATTRACAARKGPVTTATSRSRSGADRGGCRSARVLACRIAGLLAAKRHRYADELGLSQYDARAHR